MDLSPITLEGQFVKLVPLTLEHRDALVNAASDGKLWELWFTSVPNEERVDDYLNMAFEQQSLGRAIPFAVIDKHTGEVIGSTRFCNIDSKNRRLEIGYTWYAKRFQRTGVNTECKKLLLSYAFETLNVIAVEFRTHWHNQASRNAIARLGAKQDGVLRNHQIMADGCVRDTVVFSIIDGEWPMVKRSLEFKLA
ncbi:GCN5 family acetyltransferase [Pseudoalteromonas sp. XI10]|uniref:GNAT family N-acetyltransferase n=1 Tax=Pseudoalteromonas sp. XI10 TaxID=1766621 RepID=UPI0007339BE7|nr:GNAT family protein [Pseudoalteromonas sp. XI10]KTG20430.1 GCN5 family acetyltransferase [Pseudoalteromonas sp. XI10]